MSSAVVGIIALAAWLGAALLVAAVVAPAAFAVLPTRTLAGALVGRVLPVLFWSGMIVGVVVATLTWDPPGRGSRIGAVLTLLASCAAAQLVVAPRIEAIRRQIGGPLEALDPTDPRRLAFGRLHGMSVAWLGVGTLAAMVALILLVRLTTTTRSTS